MPVRKDQQGIPADPLLFDEAVKKFRARVPMTRTQWNSLQEAEREHAFMVSEVANADVITQVFEAIDRAVEKGTTLETFKIEVTESLENSWGGEKPGRIETIFRTNLMGAYNGGRHEILTAPAVKADRPFWRFDGIDDDAQTEVCSDADGTVLPADHPWWATHTPPLHFNCRSVPTPLSEEEAAEEGVEEEPPPTEPNEGFGSPPASEGSDWEPDLSEYPPEIRVPLEERLRKRG